MGKRPKDRLSAFPRKLSARRARVAAAGPAAGLSRHAGSAAAAAVAAAAVGGLAQAGRE